MSERGNDILSCLVYPILFSEKGRLSLTVHEYDTYKEVLIILLHMETRVSPTKAIYDWLINTDNGTPKSPAPSPASKGAAKTTAQVRREKDIGIASRLNLYTPFRQVEQQNKDGPVVEKLIASPPEILETFEAKDATESSEDGNRRENFKRRRRRKTKDDCYMLKEGKRKSQRKEEQPQKKKRRKEASATALLHRFNAENVTSDRLTVSAYSIVLPARFALHPISVFAIQR